MEFRLFWNRHMDLELMEYLFIRNSADGSQIDVGDTIYVVSGSADCRLLARLVVREIEHDQYRARIRLSVGGSRSAYFFSRSREAAEVRLVEEDRVYTHREATLLEPDVAQSLATICGTHDFGCQPCLRDGMRLVVVFKLQYRDQKEMATIDLN